MSSDVYIDFNEDKEGADYDRIGHLGTISYYEINLLEQVRTLEVASGGVVTQWLPEAIERLFSAFQSWVAWANQNTMKASMLSSCNWIPGSNDFVAPHSVRMLFEENMGKTWQTRVD
jgi:hypothetical protein